MNPIQDESVRGCSWIGGNKVLLPKICHAYPDMMKLGTVVSKKDKKKLKNHVTHILSSIDTIIFHQESANIAISRNTDTDWILIYNSDFCNIFESLKVVLINMVKILVIPAKLSTQGLLKTKLS